MPKQDEYCQALHSTICVKCLDGDGRGECRIADDRVCALKTFLPQVVETVNAVYSHSIAPYEEQLRKKVCRECRNQSAVGQCILRDEMECALDRYFPLIVEVIEETQKRAHLAGSKWA